ncbi:hypothetical protein Q7P37_002480 [Cladosporium fusiforme]
MNICTAVHSFISARSRDPSPSKPEVEVPAAKMTRRKKLRGSNMTANAKSPIATLPPELLSRIFSYINAPPRIDVKTIASCRLVCKNFLELSSPFLITTVVIAERLSELKKLREVMEHPYFHKHVTHLIWDASTYEEALLDDPGRYSRRWARSSGCMESTAVRYAERLDNEAAAELLEYDIRPQRPWDSPTEAQTTRPWDMDSDNNELSDTIDMTYDDEETLRSYERSCRDRDAFSEYGTYQRRFANQKLCQKHKLASRYLNWAFVKLPRLCHLSYTDWRALSRYGESYKDLCQRLFLNSLPPRFMDGGLPSRREYRSSFKDFLAEVSHIDPTLRSFWIGGNNFEIPEMDVRRMGRSPDANLFGSFLDDRYLLPHVVSAEWEVLHSVRSLRLPLVLQSINGSDSKSNGIIASHITKALEYTLPNLVHLELCTNQGQDPDSESEHDLRNYDNRSCKVLSKVLRSLEFAKLQTLVLRGWRVSLLDLGEFLDVHAGTLLQLHLIRCSVVNDYAGALDTITNLWAPNVNLQGVEITHVQFEPCDEEPEPVHICGHALKPEVTIIGGDDEEFENILRRTRPDQGSTSQRDFDLFHRKVHPFDRYDVGFPLKQSHDAQHLRDEGFYHEVRLCPGERPDFERAILRGRKNNVSRLARFIRPKKSFKSWTEVPVYPS